MEHEYIENKITWKVVHKHLKSMVDTRNSNFFPALNQSWIVDDIPCIAVSHVVMDLISDERFDMAIKLVLRYW